MILRRAASADGGAAEWLRWVVVLTLIGGGTWAAATSALCFWASGNPAIEVEVALATPAATLEAAARDGIALVEEAARRLPGLAGMAGEVFPVGGWMRLRFASGTDVVLAGRRLAGELRRPARASAVGGGGGGGGGAAFGVRMVGGAPAPLQAWTVLPGTAAERTIQALAADLEARRTVARVDRLGGWVDDIVVRWVPGSERAAGLDLPDLAAAVGRWQGVERLGAWHEGGRLAPVAAVSAVTGAAALADLEVARGVRLGRLARVAVELEPRARQLHLQGVPAAGLVVTAVAGAAAERFERDLRAAVAAAHAQGAAVEVLHDDAAAVSRLVRCLLAGLAAAALLVGAAAWRLAGGHAAAAGLAAVPAAAAAAVLACRAGGVVFDVAALLAITGGVAAALPSGLLGRLAGVRSWRLVSTAAGLAAAVPVALRLSTWQDLDTLVRTAGIFALAMAAALGGISLLPRFGARQRLPWPAWLARVLRGPEAPLLAGAAAALLAALLFGARLQPAPEDELPPRADLTLSVGSPAALAGSELAAMQQNVGAVERALSKMAMVRRYTSVFDAQHATVAVDVEAAWRSPGRLQRLLDLLRLDLPRGLASTVRPAAAADAADTGGDHAVAPLPSLEEQPSTDEDANSYRFILRGASLPRLQQSFAQVSRVLLASQVSRQRLVPSHWPVVMRRGLAPRGDLGGERLADLVAALRRRTEPAARWPVPGIDDRAIVVAAAGVSLDPALAPQSAALLNTSLASPSGPVVAAALLRPTQWEDTEQMARQAGRFVLPLEVRFPTLIVEARRQQRDQVAGILGRLALPAGVEMLRPPLARGERWAVAARRVVPLAVLVALWLLVAWLRAPGGSGLVAVALPAACGAAGGAMAAAASFQITGSLSLLLAGGGVAGAIPVALEMTEAARAAMARHGAGGGVGDARDRAEGAGDARDAGDTGGQGVGAGGAGGGTAGWRALRAIEVWEPWQAWCGLAAVLLLVVPVLLGSGVRGSMAAALGVGAATALAGGAAALYLAPAAWVALEGQRRRRSPAYRAAAQPAAWQAGGGEPRLRVQSLGKTFGGAFTALAGVDFELRPGITGLLGPNGAGKTTLMRILAGVSVASRGRLLFDGVAVSAVNGPAYRRMVGFLPQEVSAYSHLTARQFLEHWAVARGASLGAALDDQVTDLLGRVGLLDEQDRVARHFSGGMLRRLGIATALVGSPALLVVDEPTAGLDLDARAQFRTLLLSLMQKQERILLLSTHVASDIEAIASQLLVLHRGRVIYDGTVAGLIALARGRVFSELIPDGEINTFKSRYRITSRVQTPEGIRLRAILPPQGEPRGELVEPALEEAYLALLMTRTGGPAAAAW